MSDLRRQSRWIATVMLALFALGIVGAMPNPGRLVRWVVARAPDGVLGDPYPCQTESCGCVSADECFDSCCCNSDAALMAFAVEHGLDHRVAQLHARGVPVHAHASASAVCEDVLCEDAACKEAECESAELARFVCTSRAPTHASDTPSATLHLAQALRCKGMDLLVAFGVATASVHRAPEIAPRQPGSHPALCIVTAPAFCTRSLGVPAPPPRACIAAPTLRSA